MSSPTPPNNPLPLTIGRTFLKQYYQVLTTTPDMIYKFYRPSSVLSHGEGNNPTAPATLESLDPATELKDRFFSWADSAGAPVRFELEHGAIDAQESVGGGVLLVVTGHLYLGESRKSFCHTFFLNCFSAADSKKRQYYVHNDVLRFLKEEAPVKESALSAVAEEPAEESVVAEEEKPAAEEDPVEEAKEEEPETVEEPVAEPPAERVEGVEETKEEPVFEKGVEETKDSEPVAKSEPTVEESKESAPKPVSKPPPGSWASLVAGSGSNAAPTPALTKPAPKPVEKKKEQQQTVKKQEKKDDSTQKGIDSKPQRHKRDPDCTLVIKGVPDGTKEGDVRLVFEPFATQTNAKILGITVSQRGLAFVDYDAAAPVLAALGKKDQFSLNGKSVDVDQKTNDNKNRNRGGNNNNNNRSNGYRSGGRGNNDNQRQRNNGSRSGGGGARNGKSSGSAR